MPDLHDHLQGRDLGFLRIVAHLWGIDISAPDAHTALPALVMAMLDRPLVAEVAETLPLEARNALASLAQNEGRMPWSMFTRRFGKVREMGPGRRDRERPHLSPISPSELLWYRALIGRAFFEGEPEPQEYAYIPDDLIALLPPMGVETPNPPGRPASPAECAHPIPATDRVLDHATTLLAALRLGRGASSLSFREPAIPPEALLRLLTEAGLLDPQGLPFPEPARAFLEARRGDALAVLFKAWRDSTRFNELRQVPGLKLEGDWSNNPVRARHAILDLLARVPGGRWWSLASFVGSVKAQIPDFQRPAGDYDSWFIRQEASGEYLRGFTHWDEVDGALVRYLVSGPMAWMGLLDLASPSPGSPAAAFRTSIWAGALLEGAAPGNMPPEDVPLQIASNGRLRLFAFTPRAVRYQIARFCAWESETANEYRYRITPESLEQARGQGLRLSHLMGLLRRHAAAPLPPSLVQALERWDQQGAQARLEQAVILRLGSPDLLAAVRHSKAARFLGDVLGPTTVIVKPGAQEKILTALAEMGYLAASDLEKSSGSIIPEED
jgi:hypothetical protein